MADKFLSRESRCLKCRHSGRLRFYVRPDEASAEAVSRTERDVRGRCVSGCQFTLDRGRLRRTR